MLASMLGAYPSTVWTRPIPGATGGFLSRCEVRNIHGDILGAAEQVCTRDETMWSRCDDYALMGMAQTRATVRALRQVLGFIMPLAGYSATPADEMTRERPVIDAEPEFVDRSTGEVVQPAPPRRATHPAKSNLIMPFGRAKGKAIDDPSIDLDDLVWMGKALNESIKDPDKAKWKDSNTDLRNALREVVAGRMGETPPPPAEPVGEFEQGWEPPSPEEVYATGQAQSRETF